MSQNHTTRTSAVVRYPKRKRAQVSYAEPDLEGDEDHTDGESQDAADFLHTKKRKSASSKPLPKHKVFPFLQLPAEIRNEIYSHCLTDPAGIYLRSTTKKFRRTVHRVSQEDLVGHHDSDCLHMNLYPDYTTDSDNSDHTDDASNADASSTSGEEDREIAKESRKKHRGPATEIAPLVPTLLAVCKQINQEAGDLLYSHHFYVENPLALHSFLVDIGPRVAKLLRHVDMMEWSDGRGHKSYNHTCFTALMSATNLVSFNTHGYMRCEGTAKHIAIQMYRDGFPWLEAIAREKGKTDAAVDVFNIKCTGHYASSEPDVDYKTEMRKLLNARMDRLR